MKFQSAVLPLVGLGLTTQACLLPEEIGGGSFKGRSLSSTSFVSRRQNSDGFSIGTGDRFKNGTIAPQGLGMNDRDLKSILSVKEVDSALKGLSAIFGSVQLFTTPHTTHDKRRVQGAVIGKSPRVFIQSGLHARERGGPDHVLYFIADLLRAHANGVGIKWGGQSYDNRQVNIAMSAGIAIVPLVNPDGVAYDQQNHACWRKNRNPGTGRGVGVDLNRNFDAMWDFKKLFNPKADYSTSDDPSSPVYYGPGPGSEPETKNVAWVMDKYPDLSWFLDLHSFGGDVLYSWGDDNSQTTDPAQNFLNATYNGKRGFLGTDPADSVYREFIEAKDFRDQELISTRMSAAMSKAGSIKYSPQQSADLYPTSGGSTDYSLSGYYGQKCNAKRIQGLTIEFGNESGLPCPFYPTQKQYHESMRQVAVGLMELLLFAAGDAGKLKTRQCYPKYNKE